ncbi:MAG: 5-formyltetrahydrofolate cyclo-ligase [Steroidobacteraceae bacterium]
MKNITGEQFPAAKLASSPCLLDELREDGTPIVDPEQVRDVARWRKAERERLIRARCSLDTQYRADQTLVIARKLEEILAASGLTAPAVSVYWPIRGEPDLRPWTHALSQAGARVALPVAVALAQPLIFREWRPNARLARGLWKIPYPADGELIVPDVVIAPVVGFDHGCYRLGYGGGFFDRTLAQLSPKPLAIGVGYPGAELRTIFPQPHDIPMDWVVTGSGTLQVHC